MSNDHKPFTGTLGHCACQIGNESDGKILYLLARVLSATSIGAGLLMFFFGTLGIIDGQIEVSSRSVPSTWIPKDVAPMTFWIVVCAHFLFGAMSIWIGLICHKTANGLR